MVLDEVLKYLNRFLLAIPKNYEDLFNQSSFSDNTDQTVKFSPDKNLCKNCKAGMRSCVMSLRPFAPT
jgi:hypothetical protein